MEIERTVDGRTITFKLSDEELEDAYYEQQNIFDKEDIETVIEDMDDNDTLEYFGITKREFEDLVPEMADQLRQNLDKYDMLFDDARISAIKDIIGVYDI